MLKYIIFDFDGVIGDSYSTAKEIFDSLKDEHKLQKFDFSTVRDIGIKDSIKRSGESKLKLLFLLKKVQDEFHDKLSEVNMISGMNVVIDRLSRFYKLGILTSNSKKNVNTFLKKHGLKRYFEFVHSERSIFSKHKVMKKIMHRLDLDKDELVYVGDEDRDIDAMKKAGVRIISVTWGYNSEKHLKRHKPDFLAKHPDHIYNYITYLDGELDKVRKKAS